MSRAGTYCDIGASHVGEGPASGDWQIQFMRLLRLVSLSDDPDLIDAGRKLGQIIATGFVGLGKTER